MWPKALQHVGTKMRRKAPRQLDIHENGLGNGRNPESSKQLDFTVKMVQARPRTIKAAQQSASTLKWSFLRKEPKTTGKPFDNSVNIIWLVVWLFV